jgi:hypothetical protein
MKSLITFAALLGITFISCKEQPPAEAPSFLPGIYVSQNENEFCRITDTLIILKMNLGAANYLITRRSAFQRIRQGEIRPVEFQSQQWQATYDVPHSALLPAGNTEGIRYSAEKNKVYKGDWEYEKVE